MKTVYKYRVPITDRPCALTMPIDARILHVAVIREGQGLLPAPDVFFWAEVCVEPPPAGSACQTRVFQVFGTGEPVIGSYIGTALDRWIPWHLYELTGVAS